MIHMKKHDHRQHGEGSKSDAIQEPTELRHESTPSRFAGKAEEQQLPKVTRCDAYLHYRSRREDYHGGEELTTSAGDVHMQHSRCAVRLWQAGSSARMATPAPSPPATPDAGQDARRGRLRRAGCRPAGRGDQYFNYYGGNTARFPAAASSPFGPRTGASAPRAEPTACALAANGQRLTRDLLLNQTTAGDRVSPVIAGNAAGDFVAVWLQESGGRLPPPPSNRRAPPVGTGWE